MITGRGPTDPDQRKALMATGWQPHSIRVGDSYVQYQRGDPFATMAAFYADAMDLMKYTDDDETGAEVMFAGFTSLLANLESKSYLQGMTDFADILSNPDKHVERVAGRIAGGFIPFSALVASGRSVSDPQMNSVNGFMDTIWNRIPGLGPVDKQRNIMGEAMNKKTFDGAMRAVEGFASMTLPTTINHTSSDTVNTELAQLAYPFSGPSPKKWGADLREYKNDKDQSAHDRWQELTSEVKLDGRNLRSTLDRLIKSRRYQALPVEGIANIDEDSPRISMIRRVVNRFRRKAERSMLGEFPQLKERSRHRVIAQRALRSGEDPESIKAQLFPLD